MIAKTRANGEAPSDQLTTEPGPAKSTNRPRQIRQHPHELAYSRSNTAATQTQPRNNRTLGGNTRPQNQRAGSSRSSKAREGSTTCAGSAGGGTGRERSGSAGLPTPLMALPPLLPRRCCSLGGARAHHHHHHLSAFFEEGREGEGDGRLGLIISGSGSGSAAHWGKRRSERRAGGGWVPVSGSGSGSLTLGLFPGKVAKIFY